MANGNGLGSELWKEVPAWFKVGMQFGFPTLAAGWFIYVLTTGLLGDVKELKASVLQHVSTTDNMMMRLNEQRTEQNAKLDVLIRIAQTQCVNAATDALQRRDCVNAVK